MGRLVKENEDDLKIWDYVGVESPVGLQTKDQVHFFDQEEISKLVFIG